MSTVGLIDRRMLRHECAAKGRVSLRTIDNLLATGQLAHTKVGRRVLIPESAFNQLFGVTGVSADDPVEDSPHWTVADLCREFRITAPTAYGYIRSGELRTIKIGAARRIPAEAVAEFIAARRVEGGGMND